MSLIADLPTKTASGPDGISSYILKSTASSIASPFSHIFNLSISSGLFPLTWKSSHIVPIPKSSPPSTSPSDFCPISLLSLVSKLLEKHVHSILLDFCFQQDLISPCNLVSFLLTQQPLPYCTVPMHSVLSLLESNFSACSVFLDLKKAFDSVPHSPLLNLL